MFSSLCFFDPSVRRARAARATATAAAARARVTASAGVARRLRRRRRKQDAGQQLWLHAPRHTQHIQRQHWQEKVCAVRMQPAVMLVFNTRPPPPPRCACKSPPHSPPPPSPAAIPCPPQAAATPPSTSPEPSLANDAHWQICMCMCVCVCVCRQPARACQPRQQHAWGTASI